MLAASLVLAGGAVSAQTSAENSPGSCAAPPEWFTTGIPDPDVLAQNGDFFDSLCAFHTWSWNAFLWLMEEDDGVLRFETLPTLAQVKDGSYDASATAPDTALLALRVAKEDHPIDSVAQAATPGILVDQNGRSVYYSQFVNVQMYDQIRDLNWFTAAGLQAESDLATFDVGNIELKASWKVLSDGEDASYAYVRDASIPKVANNIQNGVTVIGVPKDPKDIVYEDVKVALVGFHVVGWVAGHAEAIWATFSPPGIAPVAADGQTSGPVSMVGSPFYAANAAMTECNQTAVPIQTLVEDTQIFSVKTNACQVYAEGTLPVAEGQPNANRVIIGKLNASVLGQLPAGSIAGKYAEIGAVWSISDFKAFCQSAAEKTAKEQAQCAVTPLKQTVLESPGQIVGKLNTTFQDELKGSNVLSNPVVETFTQTTIGQDNCFGCHNSIQYQPSDPRFPSLKASMLNVSHIILEAYVSDLQKGN